LPAHDQPKTAAFQKRVMRFCSGRGYAAGPWRDWDADGSLDWICRQFAALTPEERMEAERWRDAYLLDIAARKSAPQRPGIWLRDRIWTGLEPIILERAEKMRQGQLPPEERQHPEGWAKCLGPIGMARLFAELIDGQKKGLEVRQPFISDVQLRNAWPFVWQFRSLMRQKGGASFGQRWHELKPAMEAVPQGSDTLAAWKQCFAERGWLWFSEFDRVDVVFCPVGGPDGLEAFEAAIRGIGHDGAERQAAE